MVPQAHCLRLLAPTSAPLLRQAPSRHRLLCAPQLCVLPPPAPVAWPQSRQTTRCRCWCCCGCRRRCLADWCACSQARAPARHHRPAAPGHLCFGGSAAMRQRLPAPRGSPGCRAGCGGYQRWSGLDGAVATQGWCMVHSLISFCRRWCAVQQAPRAGDAAHAGCAGDACHAAGARQACCQLHCRCAMRQPERHMLAELACWARGGGAAALRLQRTSFPTRRSAAASPAAGAAG
jgi:hypothetical protein